MRRPMLMAVLLSAALGLVIFAKIKLDESIEEGRFAETPVSDAEPLPNTIDIGVEADPEAPAPDAAPHAGASSKIDIMAALVEARQSFKTKTEARNEVTENPHATPPVIIRAAESLGRLLTLEKQNPAYKPEFQAFYVECAKDKEVLTVTRVQCLENYAKSKEMTPEEEAKILGEVDPIVKQLYLELKK